jgi:DNA invertase Pin-like site-specific DNA recombinase
MIYGYLRVSSDEQDVNSQKQGVEKFAEQKGWEIEQYITDEGVSGGKDPVKRNLGPMLKKLKKDDIVIAAEISRLGRDLYMVMDILHFCMKTGCKIYTVKDNFALDDNIQSKVLAFAFGLAAEIERQMIRQRTREGLALRRKLGVLLGKSPLGRKSDNKYKCEPYEEEILKAIEWGAPIISIAKKIGVSKNAVYYSLARWRVKFDDAAAKRFYDNERKKNKRYRDAVGLRDHLQEVELPWEHVKELILQDKTIPEIHQHMPQYTYDQVYDSILCNDEMNILYRQHGQLRVKKRHYVNYKKTI